jgi:hypothetical protein
MPRDEAFFSHGHNLVGRFRIQVERHKKHSVPIEKLVIELVWNKHTCPPLP